MKELTRKVVNRDAVIGIIGLGYVGLPLAVAFGRRFRVYGFDTDPQLIAELKKGVWQNPDAPSNQLRPLLGVSLFPTGDETELTHCDFLLIDVPTPLRGDREPDLGFVVDACEMVRRNLRLGQFVILESTTYPGTTETVLLPILEGSGLKAGEDFGIAYSPERIDLGSHSFPLRSVPKVVGGLTPECTEIACQLYRTIIDEVVPVRDCKTAEATKMLENIFRIVNISMVNEMAMIFERMGINTWEVVDAAATKPFGFLPFYPGPGAGGHCIPVDPFFLSYRAKQFGVVPRFIELSGEINEFMKFHVVRLLEEGLTRARKPLHGANVVLFGLAYKRDVPDTRESPSRKVLEELRRRGVKVRVYDPLVPRLETLSGPVESVVNLEAALEGADALILMTDHTAFRELDYEGLSARMESPPVLVDTRNLVSHPPRGSIYVGLGKGLIEETTTEESS